MKILIDARSMGSKSSGVGIYIYNFSKELLKENIKIILASDIAVSSEMKQMKQLGADVKEYGKKVKKNFSLWGYYKYIQKLIYKIKPDVFWEGNNLFPIKIVNPYGKVVVTVHDIFPVTYPQYYGKLYSVYFRFGLNNTLKHCDCILYNSKETKKEMEAKFKKAQEKKSFVSYIIVNLPYGKVLSDKNYFLYIGNLEKRKGIDILLKAYRLYKKKGGEKSLIIAGNMREKEIKDLYKKISIETKGLYYMGYVDDEEKSKLLSECSCLVFPSRAEGFGIPIIEAIHFNKAIIAGELRIFKEILGDSINYFNMQEPEGNIEKELAKLLDNYEKRVDEYTYTLVRERFKAESLGKKLRLFFEEIVI